MYAWLFRHLPGPLWLRIIQTVLLVAFVVLLLMVYVFPWANQYSPWTDSTVGDTAAASLTVNPEVTP